ESGPTTDRKVPGVKTVAFPTSVRAPAGAMLAAAVDKALLNWLLVPPRGTAGAASAGAAAYLLAAAINIALLARLAGLHWSWSASVLKPAVLLVALACAAAAAMWGTSAALGALGWAAGGRAMAAAESLLGVAAGAVVFVIGLARLWLIPKAEVEAVPKLDGKGTRLNSHHFWEPRSPSSA
ncbi:hypothetical protein E4V51_29655, partial [Paenibacillus sp. 28ISP30-2]|nr:hypothetical protein [Paenibacillus sp. 28ISP30-2]